jgi:multidrug efflux pump
MNISAPFVARPVATTLLMLAIVLAGILGFSALPVAPLPRIDLPTIVVFAQLPGASPNTQATSVAAPLERHLGQIAGVTEMTSRSTSGRTGITLQFDIDRDIDGAARDVEAAINAARADLSSNLPGNPTYHKYNPADAPILSLALTSKTMTPGQIYGVASNVLAQRLAQLRGIGNVDVGGSSPYAVRVEINAQALYKYGIGLEDVRAALAAANANSPKGTIDDDNRRFQIYTNDQAVMAADYAPLVIAYRNGAAVRLSDVADVQDSVEDVRNLGWSNGRPAVLVTVFRQPGANIIKTVDNVKAELPHLEAAMPADVNVAIAIDPSATIRASLHDAELTLIIAIGLVTLVVYLLLCDIRATLIASATVPISIIGTFGAMYLLGYSLDILSLMALTIATGFVVDDAFVVLENISRHIEAGMPRREAALRGAREVGLTVLSISLSLIVVLIPVLLMGGILGRMFREFTATLTIAIIISMVVSLTAIPMMSALFLRPQPAGKPLLGRFIFARVLVCYGHTLGWTLRHHQIVLSIFVVMIGLNVALFVIVPKGFVPKQDTGRLYGWFQADQGSSFQRMSRKLRQTMDIIQQDPAVENVVGFTGANSCCGGSGNTGAALISLKPLSERQPIDRVTARLQPQLARVPYSIFYLGAIQDIPIGGSQSNSQYQYTLLSDAVEDIDAWTPKLVEALAHSPVLTDIKSDQPRNGLETDIVIDRDTSARLGISPLQIDNTLYDAFGQRQVSVIYGAFNQYHVVMEIDPRYTQYPISLRDVYVATSGANAPGTATANAPAGTVTPATTIGTVVPPRVLRTLPAVSSGTRTILAASVSPSSKTATSGTTASVSANYNSARNVFTNALANSSHGPTSAGTAVSTTPEIMIPLAAVSQYKPGQKPLSVNHQGLFVASTISFNLRPGMTLGQAVDQIKAATARIHMPGTVRGTLSGTAQLFQQALAKEPIIILAAIAAVYVLLGVLYESYIHPITILSTLPPAGVGALLALMLFRTEFDISGLIGVILLIGIVKKNAIIMIDFAIETRRSHHLSSYDAIYEACLLRFRPIIMTTTAAILSAIPLALSFGQGAELRRPLGLSIVGGLLVSQLLTLYTTPVLYLYMDQFGQWASRRRWQLFRGPR